VQKLCAECRFFTNGLATLRLEAWKVTPEFAYIYLLSFCGDQVLVIKQIVFLTSSYFFPTLDLLFVSEKR
jgi:hypothetical protein